jgi:FemAB-related protein (PEP-CTERM system-associated)
MSNPVPSPAPARVQVRRYRGKELSQRLAHLEEYALRGPRAEDKGQRTAVPLSRHPRWLSVLEQAFGHTAYALEAVEGERTVGYLPLAYVRSLLFGRHLVSLPYLNSNGVLADDEASGRALVEHAVGLADELNVRHLELRHERPLEHPALTGRLDSKVHMRLPLPDFPGQLWEQLSGKVRNQVRKAEKGGLGAFWGGLELLPEFYAVFSQNMRDLGTPVYGRELFRAVLEHFPEGAELCVVRAGPVAVAAALLLHGPGVSEVPSASSLRQYNSTCANMLLYWGLLERAVLRGQAVFDFGRSTVDGNTHRFKKQWGAAPEPATWQYYERTGHAAELRPDNPRYQRLIRIWQRLPVRLTRWLGPAIVRGIP